MSSCVAKGGRGYFRLTYRQPKFTLFSQKKRSVFEPLQKSISPTISEIEPHQFPKLWEIYFFATPHNFANRPHFVALTQLGRPKQGQTFVVPTFHIHFLNPECVRIPWIRAPKNFPIENFRVRSNLQKSSIFHWFLFPPPKKKYRARVPTILMPQTFPIASLNRYTPKFSGAA